jgi:hypothetical protein
MVNEWSPQSGDLTMAQSPANSGDGEKIGPFKPQDSSAADKNLPMVLAPKLGAGEDETLDDAPGESSEEAAAIAEPAASPRFLMLAATVAFAAAFGSFVGSVSGSGFAGFLYPAAPVASAQNTSDTRAENTLKQELAELSVIKTNLDAASRNTTSQFAKLADRLDRIDAHAAVETTGSIAAAPTAPAAAPPPADPVKLADRILPDWIVQDVQNGRALVASRNGGMFDVGAGSFLPGVGRVDSIKRQDGQWIVLTARGTIISGR